MSGAWGVTERNRRIMESSRDFVSAVHERMRPKHYTELRSGKKLSLRKGTNCFEPKRRPLGIASIVIVCVLALYALCLVALLVLYMAYRLTGMSSEILGYMLEVLSRMVMVPFSVLLPLSIPILVVIALFIAVRSAFTRPQYISLSPELRHKRIVKKNRT